jgi:tellurite resistance protein
VRSLNSDAQDVTEEFYDVDARLRNKRVEEQRLVEHLKKSTARLQDILAVEREISRVRGEIEQMEGRCAC